jgi:hypothetical protein
MHRLIVCIEDGLVQGEGRPGDCLPDKSPDTERWFR